MDDVVEVTIVVSIKQLESINKANYWEDISDELETIIGSINDIIESNTN